MVLHTEYEIIFDEGPGKHSASYMQVQQVTNDTDALMWCMIDL
jgi:hypothetical protein